MRYFIYKKRNPKWETKPETFTNTYALWEEHDNEESFLNSKLWLQAVDTTTPVYSDDSDYCTLCTRGEHDELVPDYPTYWGDCKDCGAVDQSPNFNFEEEGWFNNRIIIGKARNRTVVVVWEKISEDEKSDKYIELTKEILNKVEEKYAGCEPEEIEKIKVFFDISWQMKATKSIEVPVDATNEEIEKAIEDFYLWYDIDNSHYMLDSRVAPDSLTWNGSFTKGPTKAELAHQEDCQRFYRRLGNIFQRRKYD